MTISTCLIVAMISFIVGSLGFITYFKLGKDISKQPPFILVSGSIGFVGGGIIALIQAVMIYMR